MKKNIKVTFIVILVAMLGYTAYSSQRTNETMSDIMLDNVEALASGEENNDRVWERFYRPEGDGYNCTKTGNETC